MFKNSEVSAKYESAHVADPVIHIPGGKNKNGWKGNLSAIPLAAADRLFARPGQNLLKLKEAPKAAKSVTPGKEAEKKEP